MALAPGKGHIQLPFGAGGMPVLPVPDLYHLYVAYAGSLEAHAFRSTHLAFVMVLCFLLRPLGRKKWTDPKNAWFALDLGSGALVIAVQVYTLWDLEAFIFRRGDLTDWDIRAGTALLLTALGGHPPGGGLGHGDHRGLFHHPDQFLRILHRHVLWSTQ
jgi:hypothetical protein